MANTFSSELMPRILAGALKTFREETVLAQNVAKDFNGAAGALGQVVSVSVPAAASVDDVTPAATPPAIVNTTPGVVQITIDQWKQSRFHLTEKEALEIVAGVQVPSQINESARILAYTLNAALMSTYKKIYGYAGTAGANPFTTNVTPVADVKQVLDYQMCPEGNRMLVVGLAEENKALSLTDTRYALYAGDQKAFRDGKLGSMFGMQLARDRQIPSHTAGTITTGLIAKAATAVAAGLKTCVGTTAGSSGACALLVGDIIQIGSDALNTYTLTAVATQASAASDVTLTFEPGLRTALAGSEAITVKATHRVNLALDPAALGLVMRTPGNSIQGAPVLGEHFDMADPQTGIPMRLSYFPGYHLNQWELSILYGYQLIDPRRAARLAG
jgi:hypothetical protein